MAEQTEGNATQAPNAGGENSRAAADQPQPTTEPAGAPETAPGEAGTVGEGERTQPKADPRIHPSLKTAREPDGDGEDGDDDGLAVEEPGLDSSPERKSRRDRRIARLQKQSSLREEEFQKKEQEFQSALTRQQQQIEQLLTIAGRGGPAQPETPDEPAQEPGPAKRPKRADFTDEAGYLDEDKWEAAIIDHAESVARHEAQRQLETRERVEQARMLRERFISKELEYQKENPTYEQDVSGLMPLLFSVEADQTGKPVLVDKLNPVLTNRLSREEDPGLIHWLSKRPELVKDAATLDGQESMARAGIIIGQYRAERAATQAPNGVDREPGAEDRPALPAQPLPRPGRSGGSAPEQYISEIETKGKSARWMADHMKEIDRSIKAGRYFQDE